MSPNGPREKPLLCAQGVPAHLALALGVRNTILRRMRGADDVASVTCPYCFEVVELYVDPETEGSFVQDCDVCCRPWSVEVMRDERTGELDVAVGRAQ